jgi:hypothetical protein
MHMPSRREIAAAVINVVAVNAGNNKEAIRDSLIRDGAARKFKIVLDEAARIIGDFIALHVKPQCGASVCGLECTALRIGRRVHFDREQIRRKVDFRAMAIVDETPIRRALLRGRRRERRKATTHNQEKSDRRFAHPVGPINCFR